jgi:hypothetical protein
MNTNQWRNEAMRRKVGHASGKINQALSSAGTVYASPNTARLYLTLSDDEKASNKPIKQD